MPLVRSDRFGKSVACMRSSRATGIHLTLHDQFAQATVEWLAEQEVLAGVAQVRVDEEHALLGARECDREVGGSARLAFPWLSRRDHDGLQIDVR